MVVQKARVVSLLPRVVDACLPPYRGCDVGAHLAPRVELLAAKQGVVLAVYVVEFTLRCRRLPDLPGIQSYC